MSLFFQDNTVRIYALSRAGQKGGAAPKHRWTEDEREIVRRDYNGTSRSSAVIAARLGVTPCAVKGQVAKLGLARDKKPAWTEAETEQLREMAPRLSIISIARKLHRSPNGVCVKLKRLYISRRYREGWFTQGDVCELLSVDHHRLQTWIAAGALKASRNGAVRPPQNPAMWRIEARDLRAFIIKYRAEQFGRNLDLAAIVEILVNGKKEKE